MKPLALILPLLIAACGGTPTGPGGAPLHATLSIVAGNSQVDTVGKTLPVQIGAKLTDAVSGAPLGGYVLNWIAVDGGTLFVTVTQTGSDGIGRNSFTLDTHAGPQRIVARYIDPQTGAAVTLDTAYATGIPAPAVAITFMAEYPFGTVAHVGDTVRADVRYQDQFANVGALCADKTPWNALTWTFDTTVVRLVGSAIDAAVGGAQATFVAVGTGGTVFSVTTACGIPSPTAGTMYALNVH